MNFVKALIREIKEAWRDFLEEEKPMKYLLHKKDTKFFCNHCNDFVMQLNKDAFTGDTIMASMFYNNKGQAPFVSGQRCMCKNCGESFIIDRMRKENPE